MYVNLTARIPSNCSGWLAAPSKRATRLARRKTSNSSRWQKGYPGLQLLGSLPGQGAGVEPEELSWETFVSTPGTGWSHQTFT